MIRTFGLLDTSVFVAQENGRPLDADAVPDDLAVSTVTLAELQVGVYAARDTETRSRRWATFDRASAFQVLAADEDTAAEWARLRYRLAETKRRITLNDLWIASIALTHGLPVVTQDADFDVLTDLGGPEVIRV
jgi:predicted nucleic acid-binding protein